MVETNNRILSCLIDKTIIAIDISNTDQSLTLVVQDSNGKNRSRLVISKSQHYWVEVKVDDVVAFRT